MICPRCGTNLPAGTLVCPACHANVSQTTVLPSLSARFCKSCGALIPDDSDTCPSCGMPCQDKPIVFNKPYQSYAHGVSSSAEDDISADATTSLPRIESAIPSKVEILQDEEVAVEDKKSSHALLSAAMASLFLIGGIALVLAHPWNPQAYTERAQVPADTSHAGFPGEIDNLAGQDINKQKADLSGDEVTYKALIDSYQQYSSLAKLLDNSQEELKHSGIEGDESQRKAGLIEAQKIGIQISNTISTVEKCDTTTVYADDIKHMLDLGNYLRNRSDAITEAWRVSYHSDNPQDSLEEISAPISGKNSRYNASSNRRLFETYYAQYKIEKKSSED